MNFITDHLAKAKARLIEQYKGKALIEGTLDSLVAQVQILEDVFKVLSTDRSIDTSYGIQLDKIGAIVGLDREPGQADEDYRLLIKSRIVQNLNQGTPEEVIAAAKFFIGAAFVWYLEVYPASVDIMTTTVLSTDQAIQIREQLEKFLPAAVSLDILGQYDLENPFLFDGGSGFGTDDESDGALLAEIY